MIRIGRFPVQTPLGAWLGLGTQPCYEDPGDLPVEIVKTVINTGLVRLQGSTNLIFACTDFSASKMVLHTRS